MDKKLREKNKHLFTQLLALAEQKEFTDEYLQILIEFWQLLPENEVEGNIFYARYALEHDNVQVALEYALKAYAKRKINWELWRILRDCYAAKRDFEKAVFFAGCADKFYREPVVMDIPRESIKNVLDMFTLAMGRGNYAPVAISRMRLTDNGIEEGKNAIYAGEFLPEEVAGKYRLFSGAYVEQTHLDQKGKVLQAIKDIPEIACLSGADFIYDLVRLADRGKNYRQQVGKDAVLIGLTGSCEHQQIDFKSRHEETTDYLGQWSTSFFRLSEDTELTSKGNILCTPPIVLRHDRKRRKVVINMLLDGLCWRAIKDKNYELVPNILKFFSKGVIFNNHYSVSEYTFPSLATIETGLYPYHSQIFNERASHALNKEHPSISEHMHELGYYCVNIMGDGSGVYSGTARGYDRLIVTAYNAPAYVGVERTIHHLEAFKDTDQFIFLHAEDTHPWAAHTFQLPITTQTVFDLRERSMKMEEKKASVYLPNRPIYHHWNQQGIKDCDRACKNLFDYLEENYDEDEYLLTLYSDHGVSIYGAEKYVLSHYQTGAAFMMRGGGVPALGLVDELTSALDIYPSLAKCLGFSAENIDGNLPAAMGGKKREYTVSMCMFPGIPYMICLRTPEFACHAKSQEILDEDGRVDLSDMKIELYKRDSYERLYNADDLEQYFHGLLAKETRYIDNWGTQWPEMRQARIKWFDERSDFLL